MFPYGNIGWLFLKFGTLEKPEAIIPFGGRTQKHIFWFSLLLDFDR